MERRKRQDSGLQCLQGGCARCPGADRGGHAEQKAFADAFAKIEAKDRLKHNVNLQQMGGIVEAILEGEILYRVGNYEKPSSS